MTRVGTTAFLSRLVALSATTNGTQLGRFLSPSFWVSGVRQDLKSDLELSVVHVSMLAASSFQVADISHAD